MAPDVENVVYHYRDGARREPQVHRPDMAPFRLARGIGHVTPLLQIAAPHGPLGGARGGTELGGRPLEHTGDGVRQERPGDPGAQDGDDTQTEHYAPYEVSASG